MTKDYSSDTKVENAYGTVSIVNHWLLAAIVIGLLFTGFVAGEFVEGETRTAWVSPHKAVGVLSLALLAWVVLWRFLRPEKPGPVPGTPPWEALARKAMHAFLILGTAILAVSGIVMAIFKGKAVDVFGLFAIPAQEKIAWLAASAHEVHVIGGWILLFAVLGHAGVALKHHAIDHDSTFSRMVSGRG